MYKQTLIFIVIIFCLSVDIVFSDKYGHLPSPTFLPEEKASLDKGEPIHRIEQFEDSEGNQAGRGVAYIIIRDVPDGIWKVILDYEHYPDFYPQVKSVQLTRKEGDHYYVNFLLNLFAFFDFEYDVDHTFIQKNNMIRWEMDQTKENDFKETTGFWKIWTLSDGNSLVCYSVYVEIGRWIPNFVQRFGDKLGITSWAMEKVVICMKKKVEMGDKYKREADRKIVLD